VHGDEDGLSALWRYTTKLVEHLSLHLLIGTDSQPS
jgi:hypothetical protein